MAGANTIYEAVARVLRDAGRPCTLDEIAVAIRDRELYAFKVKDPRGVIRQAIRRRCEGYADRDRTGEQLFRELEGRRYVLRPRSDGAPGGI